MWAAATSGPPVPLIALGCFLLGAATGRWWSARKQVAAAVAEALAGAEAAAVASNRNVVVIGGEGSGAIVYDDGSADYDYDRARHHVLDTPGTFDYHDDGRPSPAAIGAGSDTVGGAEYLGAPRAVPRRMGDLRKARQARTVKP